MESGASIVELKGIGKTFYRGKEPIVILDGLNLEIPAGSFEALMGPSGSGKSTLLNLIAGLDRPTQGTALVAGSNLGAMSDGQLAKFRARNIGFIFQAYNLLPVLTALENVELPLLLTNLSGAERKKRAQTALRVVGLEERMKHYPRQLSGGQEQRVAIARAIVNDPTIIVADEPTGDLDRKAADDILTLLERLNKEFKKTILMVTHDPHAAERATITRRLDKGQLQ
jgi:putative ABC transport system ATP-binding protein